MNVVRRLTVFALALSAVVLPVCPMVARAETVPMNHQMMAVVTHVDQALPPCCVLHAKTDPSGDREAVFPVRASISLLPIAVSLVPEGAHRVDRIHLGRPHPKPKKFEKRSCIKRE